MFLEGNFHFALSAELWLEPGVLVAEFLILIVLHLDHTTKFLLLLGVLEKVIFDFPSFAISISVFLLPVVNFTLKGVVGLLHLGHHLLVLVDLDLVVLVVIDLAVQLQLLLLQLGELFVPVLQKIIQLLELSCQETNLVLVITHFQFDVLVFTESALDFVISE